jgi:hypothetical protein
MITAAFPVVGAAPPPRTAGSAIGLPFEILLVAAALVAGAVIANGFGSATRRRARGDASARPARAKPPAEMSAVAARATVVAGSAAAPITDPRTERDILVRACIRARDLATSSALRQVLGDALTQAGVTEEDPTGERFDPDLHRSVGVTSTADPELDAVVASSPRVGYSDHGRQMRPAEVIVFASRAGR